MHLAERAIELPKLVLLGAVLLCGVGLLAVGTLPKERTPRVKLPVIVVAVPNPGAGPATNEAQIVRRIEEDAGVITGLKDEGAIISQAVNGAAVVQFVFDDGVEVVEAKRDVESLINRVKGEFPIDAQRDPGPMVNDIAFENWPIIQVFVAGGGDGWQRREVAERLQTQIEKIAGVSGVDVFGGLEPEVHVEVDPQRMALYGFDYQQISQAIQRANLDAPTGAIEGVGGADQRVRARTKLGSLGAIAAVPLGVRDGRLIRLADVAQVSLGHKPLTSLARYGGEDAAVLLVRAKTDIDVLATTHNVKQVVRSFMESGASNGLVLGTVRDQAREINYMLKQLGTSALYGTGLVLAMLWIALGWRNASLIAVAIPFAILGTVALMWVAKRTIFPDLAINNMTLFAMILVVGMVVDGCIIVGENIFRHREAGTEPMLAAKLGIREVGGSLMSAYLTTFAAFAPMYIVRGIMGDFLELLPTVVMFSLLSAMLVDHFVLPVLSMYIMKPRRQARSSAPVDEVTTAQWSASRGPVRQGYGRMLRFALHHRLLVLGMSAVVAATPAVLFWGGALRFEFFPETDVPIIDVHFELPLGSSMERRTVAVAQQIEAAVTRAVREEEWYDPGPGQPPVRPVTTIGEPGALNIRLDNETGAGPEFGSIYVELALAEDRERSAAEIRQAILDEVPPLPGVKVRATSPKEGPPAGSAVVVRVLGRSQTSLDQLAERAREIEQIVRTSPGTVDVTNDYRLRPELVAEPRREVASLFDLDTTQVAYALNFALQGGRVSEVDFGGDEQIDIRLRNLPEHRDQFEDLARLPLRSATGKVVTLEQVANVDHARQPNIIRHYDQKRVINIRSDLAGNVLPDDVKAALVRELRPELSPRQRHALVTDGDSKVLFADNDVIIEFGGENEVRDKALADLNVAMVVAMGAMLMILTFKFNSLVQPFIVLSSVPLSLVGVSIGLMLFGFNFSISAMIGVVALAGIVVNDAIVLVDFINQLRKAGLSREQAAVVGGQLRLRPVFLTTVTTAGGLLPLALNIAGGGEFWQPLTITIICGLFFATLLQLFIIPLACYTFDVAGKQEPAGDGAALPQPA